MYESRTAARGGLLLTVLCMAQVMLVLDLVVVVVALPSMQVGLGLAAADLQWLVTSYGLAYGGFMIAAGRTGDLFGHRRVLLTGLVLFIAASAMAGLAVTSPMMFTARFLQGLGAALVSPAALALLTTNFAEGGARNRALGIWGAATAAGATAASLVGGLLTDLLSWRAIFLINIPIGIVVMLVVLRVVHAEAPPGRQRLDLPGAALLIGGAVLLVTAVTRAEDGFTLAVGLIAVASVVLLSGFVAVERRAANPLVKLSMFSNPNVRYGNLIAVLNTSAALVAQFLTAIYLQNVAGLSPLQTGLAFAPVTALIVVISGQAGKLVARFGVTRMLTAGAMTTALGMLALGVAATGDSWATVLPGLLLVGAGAGLGFAPSMMVSTTGVDDADQGIAAGVLNTSFQLGGPLGLAVIATVTAAVGFQAGYLWSLAFPTLTILVVVALHRSRRASPGLAE